MALRRQRLAVFVVALAATGFLATRFLMAAGTRARAMRAEACRALKPDTMAPVIHPGQEAPDFELADATGKKVSLRSLRGRPVLLNFWATWCQPCIEEMPSLDALVRHGAAGPVAVVTVSVDESWDVIRKFFPSGTPLTVLLDASKEVPKKYGTEKYPESFLIDSEGRVQQLFYQRKWDSAEAQLCLESLR
jgi:peroxiredoxin